MGLLKSRLKLLRLRFRENVFERDGHTCAFCDKPAEDAHHITDRTEMPNDGYVTANGISLCAGHHLRAEQFHITGGLWWFKGFHPDDLYRTIGSTHEDALRDSEELA